MSDLSEQEQWELAKQKARELWIYVVGGVALGLAGLGGWNWWLPQPLARILPRTDFEGRAERTPARA